MIPVCVMAALREKPTMDERILETADRLFYLRGIRAVGVDTIAAEIGISKRTLYNHFPSKNELIAAYLERRFTRAPASDKPPVEEISTLVEEVAEKAQNLKQAWTEYRSEPGEEK